jgi:hypothetical protein
VNAAGRRPVTNGLRSRELTGFRGELIFYERPDVAGPKLSRYVIAPVFFPDAIRNALERAIGVVGRVRKRRRLYLVQNTRIHLDR